MEEFARIQRLPPYVFAVVVELKSKLRHAGEDIIDLGMGNPDLPTPKHIVDKLVEAVRNRGTTAIRFPAGSRSCGWPSATGTSGSTTWSSTRKRRRSQRSARRRGCPTSCWRRWAPGTSRSYPTRHTRSMPTRW